MAPDYVDVFSGEVVREKFRTQYLEDPVDHSPPQSSKSQTETAYVPPQVRIMEMMDAGKRLMAYRKARFDSVELQLGEDAEIPLDPTREPGVDLVDVQRQAQAVGSRLEQSKSAAQKAAEAKARREAEAADQARIEARARALLEEREKVAKGG